MSVAIHSLDSLLASVCALTTIYFEVQPRLIIGGKGVRSIMEVKFLRQRRVVTLPFLLCLSVMTFATLTYGQAATGRLSGTVSGPDGLIANATVVVTDNQTKQVRTATTNAQGAFSFPQLAVGSYTVSFSAPGFKTLSATDV